MLPDHHDLTRQYNAIMKQIAAGVPMHPMEIWDLVQALREEGENGWANSLAHHLPDQP